MSAEVPREHKRFKITTRMSNGRKLIIRSSVNLVNLIERTKHDSILGYTHVTITSYKIPYNNIIYWGIPQKISYIRQNMIRSVYAALTVYNLCSAKHGLLVSIPKMLLQTLWINSYSPYCVWRERDRKRKLSNSIYSIKSNLVEIH